MATNNHGAISWPSQLQSTDLLSLTAAPSPPAPPPSPAPGHASRPLLGLHRAGGPPVLLEPSASPHKAQAWPAPQNHVAGALHLCATAGEAGDLQETPPEEEKAATGTWEVTLFVRGHSPHPAPVLSSPWPWVMILAPPGPPIRQLLGGGPSPACCHRLGPGSRRSPAH